MWLQHACLRTCCCCAAQVRMPPLLVLPACSAALAAAADLLRSDAYAQANTFLLAGYDTTASALASTCYLLSNNPDKQAKLLQARLAQGDMSGRARSGPC